jgi:hypothetical protein
MVFFWKTVKPQIYISWRIIYGINSLIWNLFHNSWGRERFPAPYSAGGMLFKAQRFFPAWTDSSGSDWRGTHQNHRRGSMA